MTRIGLIGWGHWGPNLGRNIAAAAGCRLVSIADSAANRLALGGQAHPNVRLATSAQALIDDPEIDAVVIATPAGTHFSLALAALRAGKHVLVEKPMTRTSDETLTLIDESVRRNLVLMVDHTFIFSSAVRVIGDMLTAGALGTLSSYHSSRLNLGIVRDDVSVIGDVATHDFALLDYLIPSMPIAVSAVGTTPVPGGRAHRADVTLSYADGFTAHVQASWMTPAKTRRIAIVGGRRMLLYDDMEPVRKVTVYEGGVDPIGPPDARAEPDRHGRTAKLEAMEPLRAVVDHFIACIAGGRRPVTDGPSGLRVMRQIEAAERSFAQGGVTVELMGEGLAT